MTPLGQIQYQLAQIGEYGSIPEYWIPKAWHDLHPQTQVLQDDPAHATVRVNPYHFFSAILVDILDKMPAHANYSLPLSAIHPHPLESNWIQHAQVYALYVRSFSAFDHDQNGEIGGSSQDISMNHSGIRETGTFLKAIALLPYIKALGFNTVYLLPIAEMGTAYKKGELGSVFCIRNLFAVDPIYHDPLFDASPANIPVHLQTQAFVEACHILGIRVLMDFVLRSTARDSKWIEDSPEWFYWIRRSANATYTSPRFSQEQLDQIHRQVEHHPHANTVPPSEEYRALFTHPPKPENIRHESREIGYVGTLEDGTEVVVPGAFADWPPDDVQAPWTDVTYLKLFKDEAFNYVAYNTIRMYDHRLHEHMESLWTRLSEVVPFYQERFGIDGARIDMGHALPESLDRAIVSKAKRLDPHFAFIAEDFNVFSKAPTRGYNAVMGNMWYHLPRATTANHAQQSILTQFVHDIPRFTSAILGACETPDTARAITRPGKEQFVRMSWVLINTLPRVIPFCLAGMEMGAEMPGNPALDLSPEEIQYYLQFPTSHFDRAFLPWTQDSPLSAWISEYNRFRQDHLFHLAHIEGFRLLPTRILDRQNQTQATLVRHASGLNPIIAFEQNYDQAVQKLFSDATSGLRLPLQLDKHIVVMVNPDMQTTYHFEVELPGVLELEPTHGHQTYSVAEGRLRLQLLPGETLVTVAY